MPFQRDFKHQQSQKYQMKDKINQDSQTPALLTIKADQCQINNKSLNVSTNNQEANLTQIYNHYQEASFRRYENNVREETQTIPSQQLKTKFENIFSELEKEKEKKQAIEEKKTKKTQKEIEQLEQKQQKQMQINQFGQMKILEQLRKNFEDISNSFNQSFGTDKAEFTEQMNEDNQKQQPVQEKEQNKKDENAPYDNQYNGYEKIFSNLESNFEKNISGILQNEEQESQKDEIYDENQFEELKNYKSELNEKNIIQDQIQKYQTIKAK